MTDSSCSPIELIDSVQLAREFAEGWDRGGLVYPWRLARELLAAYEADHALAPHEQDAFATVRDVLGESR